MARQRFIHPEIWQSEDFTSLSVHARLLFIALFSLADDEGRGKAGAKALAGIVFPGEAIEVEPLKAEIEARGMARFYQVGLSQYYELPSWKNHQKPQYPRQSKIPALSEVAEDSMKVHGTFHESSMKPHGTVHEVSHMGRDGMGREGKEHTAEPPVEADRLAASPRSAARENKPSLKEKKVSPKPMSGDRGEVLRLFDELHRKTFGVAYLCVFSRDVKIVDQILKAYSLDQTKQLTQAFWREVDKAQRNREASFTGRSRPDIPGLLRQIPNLIRDYEFEKGGES